MAGILRLSNTGTGNGQSTITTAASGDTTYTLPSGGGTFVTTSSTQALTVPFASGTVSAPSITFLGDSNTGLYSPAADTIAFTEGGVESLRIDSSGRVGIGTSSPQASARLHVYATGDYTDESAPFTVGDSTTGGMRLFFGINNTSNYGYIGSVESGTAYRSLVFQPGGGSVGIGTTDARGVLRLAGSSANAFPNNGGLLWLTDTNAATDYKNWSVSSINGDFGVARASDAFNTAQNAYKITGSATQGYVGEHIWYTNNSSEKVRIDSSGRLLVGTSTSLASGARFQVKSSTSDSSSYIQQIFNSSGSNAFSVRSDGLYITGTLSLSPYNYGTASAANMVVTAEGYLQRSTSSLRYKTDVETIEPSYSKAILSCRPVWYRSLLEADSKDWGYWGFIAEEVEQVDPRLCFYGKDEDGNLRADGVQYDRFVPHLLNLVKQQQQAIETLEAKVAALESA